MINSCADSYDARGTRVAFQTHSLPRNRKTVLHFRAYRNPFKKTSKRISDLPVPLVTAVITDFIAKKTTAYPDSYLFSWFLFYYNY